MMMSKLKVVPKSEFTLAEIYSLEAKIEAALVRMALNKKFAESTEELVVRDCLPDPDLAFATNAWINQSALAANAWTQDFSTPLSGVQNNRVIAFYKVINRTLLPNIIASRFSLGTVAVLGVLQLEELYVEEEPVGFFGPIFYTEGDTVRVEHYADAIVAIGGEQLGFPAMVCEPFGEQISRDPKTRIKAAKYA